MRSLAVVLACGLGVLVGCGDSGLTATSSGVGGAGGEGGAIVTVGHAATSTGEGGAGGGESQYPIADAGPDLVVGPGAQITVDGSHSHDPQGDPLEYLWNTPTTQSPKSSDPMFTFVGPTYPGEYTVSLQVTDPDGNLGADYVALHVKGKPTVNAGPDAGGLAGATITLAAKVSEPDGDDVTFAWTQVSGATVALSDPTSLTPTLVLPSGLTEPLVYRLVATDPEGSSAPDMATVVELHGPDSDGDLLEDDTEVALGTDPNSPDTDSDGIPDFWEIGTHELVDYAALGCDPRHRDFLIEVDAQPEVKPSPTLIAAWVAHYAGLDIPNPDGTTGIHAHFVFDSVLPSTFVCGSVFTLGDKDANPLYLEAFHTLSMCTGGEMGVSEVAGKYSYVSGPAPDGDPSNDATEAAEFAFYTLGLHELGHSLGLHHGGIDQVNYKPNYPSYMNYVYDRGLGLSGDSIASNDVVLSRGILPTIDECAIEEGSVFASVTAEDVAYLANYSPMGWTVAANGDVDWDRDGTIQSAPYELIVRGLLSDASSNFPDCTLLLDTDDVGLIAMRMASALASDPASGPMLLGKKQPVMVP